MSEELRRRSDGWFGWLTKIWDWIDNRDIDKHVISLLILYGTAIVTDWAMGYAHNTVDKSELGTAAIIAAVMAPYMALQGAAIKFYFTSRTGE